MNEEWKNVFIYHKKTITLDGRGYIDGEQAQISYEVIIYCLTLWGPDLLPSAAHRPRNPIDSTSPSLGTARVCDVVAVGTRCRTDRRSGVVFSQQAYQNG